MFSGLVAYRGRVVSIERDRGGARLRIACEGAAGEEVGVKDSVAVNGACLTATGVEGDVVSFDVVPETLERTTLRDLQSGHVVNIEYALRAGDRIGGHFVYGHVDGTLRVLSVVPEGQGKRMRLERPQAMASAIVDKGFVAIDGVSLTVAGVSGEWFEVALIPETLARTTLGRKQPGEIVNLEVDMIAKYVERLVGSQQ